MSNGGNNFSSRDAKSISLRSTAAISRCSNPGLPVCIAELSIFHVIMQNIGVFLLFIFMSQSFP